MQDRVICEGCGKKLEAGSTICLHCGWDQTTSLAHPEPVSLAAYVKAGGWRLVVYGVIFLLPVLGFARLYQAPLRFLLFPFQAFGFALLRQTALRFLPFLFQAFGFALLRQTALRFLPFLLQTWRFQCSLDLWWIGISRPEVPA